MRDRLRWCVEVLDAEAHQAAGRAECEQPRVGAPAIVGEDRQTTAAPAMQDHVAGLQRPQGLFDLAVVAVVTAGGGELALEAPVVLDVAEVAVRGRTVAPRVSAFRPS